MSSQGDLGDAGVAALQEHNDCQGTLMEQALDITEHGRPRRLNRSMPARLIAYHGVKRALSSYAAAQPAVASPDPDTTLLYS